MAALGRARSRADGLFTQPDLHERQDDGAPVPNYVVERPDALWAPENFMGALNQGRLWATWAPIEKLDACDDGPSNPLKEG
jgi:hypothetical protein